MQCLLNMNKSWNQKIFSPFSQPQNLSVAPLGHLTDWNERFPYPYFGWGLPLQGSKLKKSSGHLLATNWRNIVARCKFLVASLYINVNDAAHSQGFWYFTLSQSSEIHKNTQNTPKFGRNLIKYMSVQHIWNFYQLWGLFTCRKLVNLSWNFVTEMCKQCPETPKLPGEDYVVKNLALAMMLKALPLVQFWSVLLLKEQMMTSVRKTLKTLVWSAQNRSISNAVFP